MYVDRGGKKIYAGAGAFGKIPPATQQLQGREPLDVTGRVTFSQKMWVEANFWPEKEAKSYLAGLGKILPQLRTLRGWKIVSLEGGWGHFFFASRLSHLIHPLALVYVL